jgi:hypothetical protein
MRSPTTAILWELWARNRWAMIFALALLPVAAVLIASARWMYPQPVGTSPALWVAASMFTVLAVLMSLASLFWCFSFTAVDERGRFAGFPSRLFTLPIGSRRAVAVPLFTGLLMILLVYVAWFELVRWGILAVHFGPNDSLPDGKMLAWHLFVIGAAYVSMQTLIWLLYPVRHLRFVMLTVVASAYFWLWSWLPGLDFYSHPARWFCGVGILFLAAVFAAFKVVEWDRRGGWQGTLQLSAFKGSGERRLFASPSKAQVWFEWRRKGTFSGAVIGLVMGLSVLLWSVPRLIAAEAGIAPEQFASGPDLLIAWTLPIFALACTTSIAAGFSKPDLWLPEVTLPSFYATRPVTTADLAVAKMRAAARAIGLAWCVMWLVLVVACWAKPHLADFWWQIPEAHPLLWTWLTKPVVLATLLAVHWHSLVSAMQATLSGKRRKIVFNTWRTAITAVCVLGIASWCYNHSHHFELLLEVLPVLVALLFFWKLWRTYVSFRRARVLLSDQQFRSMLALWVVILALILTSTFAATRLNGMPIAVICFFAAWLMPAGEMPGSVVNLHENRHRGG